nr:hypothetical protein [Tanacetum cinerariifolium]
MDCASKALGFTQTPHSSTSSTSITYGDKLLSYVIKSQFKDVPPILNIYLLCYNETSDDDNDARSLWSSDDDEHFDQFEDDPTHPDARWSP